MQDDENRDGVEAEGEGGMEVLQDPPPSPWTGTELSAFLLRDAKASTCGLRNLGNTCYLNSVLQAVAHIPVLSTYLISGWPLNSHSPGSGNEHVANQARRDFCTFLAKTDQKLWSGEYKDFAPRNVYRTMIDTVPEFSQNGQQDAEEALTYILNNLHDDLFVPVPTELHPARRVILQLEHERLAMLKDQTGKDARDEDRIAQAYEAYKRSIVSDSFQSLFAQRVTCETCKQQSLTVQECFALPLELPPSSAPAAPASSSSPGKRLSGTGKNQESPPVAAPAAPVPTTTQPLPSAPLAPAPPAPPPPPPAASSGSWYGTIKGMIFGGSNGGGGAGGNGSNAPPLDLDDCLKSFFAPEILRGEDQYYCNQCKCKVDAKKTLELAHLPQVLCLQLKRFTTGGSSGNHGVSKRSLFSRDTSAGLKNFTRVRFPVDQPLDLSAYLKKPDPSLLLGVGLEEEEGAKYQLIAVVRHSGSATYGHYVAQCRTPDNKWYTFDDELVSPTHENGLFQDAYLLIYDRIPTPAEQAKKDLALAALTAPAVPQEGDSLVSREWAIKFETMCDPGPIDNLCLQCPHGLVAFPAAAKNVNDRVVSVPGSAYRELERVYSARHGPLQGLAACDVCKLAHLERERQRHEQSQLLARLASPQSAAAAAPATATVMVPKPWYQQWIRFIHNDCGPLGRGPFEGAPPPGPLSNASLFVGTEGGELKPNLKLNIHYVVFPLDVYDELCKAFGKQED